MSPLHYYAWKFCIVSCEFLNFMIEFDEGRPSWKRSQR
jgi:hypothetical protein